MKRRPLSRLFLRALAAVAASGQTAGPDLYAVKVEKVRDGVHLAYRPEPLRDFVGGAACPPSSDSSRATTPCGATFCGTTSRPRTSSAPSNN